MHAKTLLSILVLFFLLSACQLTVAPPPTQPSNTDAINTAVHLTTIAKFTEMAGSAVPVADMFTPVPTLTVASPAAWTPTSAVPSPCSPMVTATINANIRSGPGTVYDAVGSLMLGQSATIVGRNDSSTWWYINYPSAGNYAWIAGSVVTASCVPQVVQVIAAPPTPTAQSVVEDSPTDDTGGSPALPDLVAADMQVAPRSGSGGGYPVSVQVRVRNRGEAAAGSFTVEWRPVLSAVGCSWTVDSLAPNTSKSLSCNYTYVKSCVGACNIVLVVDPLNEVAEVNEDNNNQQDSYQQTP